MRYPNVKFGTAILLNATNYTLIELLDSSNNPINCDTIILQCRTAVDVLLSTDPTPGQAYGTIKAGTSLAYEINGASLNANRDTDRVTNGGFTGNATGWTVPAAPWSYNANAVDKDGDGTDALTQSTCVGVIGAIDEITFTISALTVAGITASIGGVNGVARSANGTYKEYVKATGTDALAFTPDNLSRFTIDTVSVQKLTNTASLLFAKAGSGTPYLEIWYRN